MLALPLYVVTTQPFSSQHLTPNHWECYQAIKEDRLQSFLESHSETPLSAALATKLVTDLDRQGLISVEGYLPSYKEWQGRQSDSAPSPQKPQKKKKLKEELSNKVTLPPAKKKTSLAPIKKEEEIPETKTESTPIEQTESSEIDAEEVETIDVKEVVSEEKEAEETITLEF